MLEMLSQHLCVPALDAQHNLIVPCRILQLAIQPARTCELKRLSLVFDPSTCLLSDRRTISMSLLPSYAC